MHDTKGETLRVHVPDEVGAAVAILRSATGRDDVDIITSALRTYLADTRQRQAVVAHFSGTPTGYPAAYVVALTATLVDGTVWEQEARKRAEVTFRQINRFAPTRLKWRVDSRSVIVHMAVSGQSPERAGETASKMVRNRIVDELHIATTEGLSVETGEIFDLFIG